MPLHLLRQGLLAVAVLVAALPGAQASQITLHTRASNDTAPSLGSAAANGAAYLRLVDGLAASAPTAGYCDSVLDTLAGASNRGLCMAGSNANLAFRFDIRFGLSSAGELSLRFAPDFGRGGALFLDGQLLAVDTSDLWWGGHWANSSELLTASHVAVGAGDHVLQLVGLEGCCDGGVDGQFRFNNGAWINFARGDGLPSQVPEPGVLGLTTAALLAVAALRRRRRRRG